MPTTTTMISDLINPQVMADMIDGKLPSKIKITPFAKVDSTLVGQPGDEITVPSYEYIGDAEDVAEGVKAGTTKLKTGTTKVKVKKAVKAVTLTDEAVLSGYGDPIGQTAIQLSMSIASKLDNDAMDQLQKAPLIYDGSAGAIGYDGLVDAIDKFEEEDQNPKIMYVHPKQVTQLRKDPDFKDAHKYPLSTLMTGVIGEVAGCQVIASKKVPLKSGSYLCPIIKTVAEEDTEDITPALTIYLKRDTSVEDERDALGGNTTFVTNKHYTVALSNQSMVVLAKFKATD